MEFGLHFPQPEMPADGGVIRDFVQAAEDLGYSFLNVPDHVIQTRTPVADFALAAKYTTCLLYTSPSPRDLSTSRMPSSA